MVNVFRVARQGSDNLISLEIEQADGASLLFTTLSWIKLLLDQVLHKLWWCWYPVGSLCSADGDEDEGAHDGQKDTEACALEHLEVAENEEEEHYPAHARVGVAKVLIHFLEIDAVAIDEPTEKKGVS